MVVIAGCAKPPDIEEVRLQPCHVAIGDRGIDLDYDDDGHLLARREHRGSWTQTWTYRYSGGRLFDEILDGADFQYEHDADGHHVATTLHGRTTWRGTYRDGRLAVSTDIRRIGIGADAYDIPGTGTSYTYDRYGRVTRAITSLSIGGTVTRTYAYDGSRCRFVHDPTGPAEEELFAPCPTTITTSDEQGTRVSRPIYRDGRLVQDDDYTYSFDDSGRLLRKTSLHGGAAEIFSYSCGAL